MTRNFLHNFDPPAPTPVTGATVDLDVSEIEDAGVCELLGMPEAAAYGAWSILDTLLAPTGAGMYFGVKKAFWTPITPQTGTLFPRRITKKIAASMVWSLARARGGAARRRAIPCSPRLDASAAGSGGVINCKVTSAHD
jgi:hypothetical protein